MRLASLLIFTVVACASILQAAPLHDIPWKRPQDKVTISPPTGTEIQKLEAYLKAICQDEGITFVTQSLDGFKECKPPEAPSRSLLLCDLLAKNGLDGYFLKSKRKLVVYKPSPKLEKKYKLADAHAVMLKTALKSGIIGTEPVHGSDVLTLNGPQAYKDHVMETVTLLGVCLEAYVEPPKVNTAGMIPMLFPLRYARAEQESSSLRALTLTTSQSTAVAVKESAGVVQILKTILLANPVNPPAAGEPLITSDPMRNAVIIVDFESRRSYYEDLIRELDVPRHMVEITAAIVDIEVTDGLDWQSSFLIRGTQNIESREVPYRIGLNAGNRFFDTDNTGKIIGSPFDKDPPEIPAALGTGTLGLNQTTLIVGSSYAILSNIRALEQRGKAQVLSRPSVLTLDSQPARLTDQTSTVVPVAGERQSYLYKVASGLDLVVLPRIMDKEPHDPHVKPDTRQVYLGIEVGDGNVTDQELNNPNIAVATNDNRVITQAVVRNGESLLIGGRYRNEDVKNEAGIPIISKIPIVGLPFKNKRVTNNKFQRLYLITPRIIDPNNPTPLEDEKVKMALGDQMPVPEGAPTMSEVRGSNASIKEKPPTPDTNPKKKKWFAPWKIFGKRDP
ncbi:type III secretion system YscC/HrcC family outer membrane pore protein [Roseimicrobium gellanilyticum]|uniref:Type III secretion system YscC/HrcC family outer membrane pore protein n=1 Tax=Roseimicrobium gellanilyticum TaxID=748857 RepID=A0A366H6N9_9BACT|nr:secretin N-terminal domain-containing protein [Roseimicrobium gellanilyticum]RBP36926.1 type III secretion system YscC/HrcC family outer membrane pore protein [Roseimicrobium gellanilyticum]